MPAARLALLLAACYWTVAVPLAFGLGDRWRGEEGLRMAAFRNATWSGAPAYETLDAHLSNDLIAATPFPLWPTFSIEWNGFVAVLEPADYTFRTSTDDGSTLDVDGERVVDNDGAHRERSATGTRRLEPGLHRLRVRYFQGGGRSTLSVLWAQGDRPFEPLPASQLLPEEMSLARYRTRWMWPVGATVLALAAFGGLFLGAWPWLRRLAASSTGARLGRALAALERPAVALGAMLAVGALVRMAVLGTMPAVLWPDSHVFYVTTRNILDGMWGSHDPYRTLVYPYLLAAFLGISQSPPMGTLVIAVQQLMGLLSMACFYAVGRRAFPPLVAAAGAGLLGVHAMQIFYEVSVLTESLFTLTLAVTLWLAVRAFDRPTLARVATLGLTAVLLVLVRPVAQYYVVCLLVVGAAATVSVSVPWRVVMATVMLACYALPLVLWMSVNQREYGFFGVALGRGMGLYTRVFEIDRLVPPESSAYPEVRELWGISRVLRWSPNRVRDELNYVRRYSSASADEALFRFSLETLAAHPVAFVSGSVRQWVRQVAEPLSGVHSCPSPGGHILCSGRTDDESLPPFPNVPSGGPSALRAAVEAYVTGWGIEMKPVAALALVGAIALVAVPSRRSRVAALLALTAVYFTAVPALTQVAQDRFRLPVDAILFLFAGDGVCQWAVWMARAANHWHEPDAGEPPSMAAI